MSALPILLLVTTVAVDARELSSLPGFRTSQMGYNSWYDVFMSPSSTALLATADAMASNGLQAAGYSYVNLDDGIVEVTRGPDGNLVPTAAMGNWKDLSDKLHSQNFYFGVYTDRGPHVSVRCWGVGDGSWKAGHTYIHLHTGCAHLWHRGLLSHTC